MGLFSFLNKNKQEATAPDSGYYSNSDDDALAARARAKRASSAGDAASRRKDAKAAADPMLPEKKRARRRLVGAVALALAVAVGLPMVLDSEPKPLAGEIDIRIPAKEKAPAQPLPRAVAAADALDKREQIVEPPAPMVTVAPAEIKTVDTKPDTKPETKPAAVKPADKPVAGKPLTKPDDKPAVKPPTKPDDKPAEAARATAILEGGAAPKVIDESNQKYVVQVAALATQEKVAELQEKLKGAGIVSFTQKVPSQSGDRIRVRVGPFSKEEAEKVRAKLARIGLSGSMVPN